MAPDVREGCTNYADKSEETAPDVRRDPDDDIWIVERDRARAGLEKSALGAPEVRRYIAELANFNRIVFGNVLSGIVAIVTNVAFDLREKKATITRGQVREMVRAPRPQGFRIHNKGV